MSEFFDSLSIWLPGSLVLAMLISCSAFFSASETAFFFLTRDQIRQFQSGSATERTAARLLADPDRLLTAVLFWNLLINLAYFSVGVVIVNKLTTAGLSTAAALFGLTNLVGMIVFGEVLPKSLAVVFQLRLATFAAFPLATAVAILDPLIPILSKIARLLRRSLWPTVKREAHLQPEDLEQAIDASVALNTDLLEREQKVLHNILDMNEIAVEEVMQPRKLIPFVRPNQTLSDVDLPNMQFRGYVFLLEEGDDICRSAVSLAAVTHQATTPLAQLAEEPIYVPWCATIAYVLTEFRNRFGGVAVVVNEHGEMTGIVTYQDLLETIFSEKSSRTRRILRREPIVPIGKRRYHVEGLTTLRNLFQHLRIPFDGEDLPGTLAGLFHEKLDRLPQNGDSIEIEGWQMTAFSVQPKGEMRALVELIDYQPRPENPS